MANEEYSNVIAIIAASDDPDQLRRFIKNAQDKGVNEVKDVAFRRLLEILPEETPGTIEHDFWRTIHAFEEVLREERGKTVRLSRTRQKIQRVGVKQTLADFALSKTPSDGFTMLIERAMPELTGEAIVIRHATHFDDAVVLAAKERLTFAGVDIATLPEV